MTLSVSQIEPVTPPVMRTPESTRTTRLDSKNDQEQGITIDSEIQYHALLHRHFEFSPIST